MFKSNRFRRKNLIEIINCDEKKFVICTKCYYSQNVDTLSRKTNSFASGICVTDERLVELRKSCSAKFRSFKNSLSLHSKSNCHKEATSSGDVQSRSVLATENLVRAALSVVHMKAAATHFETAVATIKACKGEVGDIGHSRKQFTGIVQAGSAFVMRKNLDLMLTPLENTGKPPHFFLTADKATINRKTNQAVLVCFMRKGERIAIPVGAPLVYSISDEEGKAYLSGGRSADLANQCINLLLDKLGLPENHLSYLVGKWCTMMSI